MGRGNRTKPSELRVAIGHRLRAARKSYEENGAAFAREVGISPQQLNHYEKGGRFPDEAFLVRFCDLTECPADWILRGRLEARMRPHMAAYIAARHPELIPNLEMEAGQVSASASPSAAGRPPAIPVPGIQISPTRGIRKKAIV